MLIVYMKWRGVWCEVERKKTYVERLKDWVELIFHSLFRLLHGSMRECPSKNTQYISSRRRKIDFSWLSFIFFWVISVFFFHLVVVIIQTLMRDFGWFCIFFCYVKRHWEIYTFIHYHRLICSFFHITWSDLWFFGKCSNWKFRNSNFFFPIFVFLHFPFRPTSSSS